eukprot:CAMPEP_0168513156 /NCGR_PEP_ID=MMETSP0405-20121227/3268_1 /TAXON_ID=498012 /ORGANISM="Trichosphaerium sp, Strain Am-I-7 wt" /LENGTH=240 /DNA_ID=CAMNT_0008531881 /DNA_START=45 /DNA_END=764 /DNA_ORIENTATION=-
MSKLRGGRWRVLQNKTRVEFPGKVAWQPAERGPKPFPGKYFWNPLNRQRELFNEIAEKLNVKVLDDWYLIGSVVKVFEHGGGSVMNRYSGCISKALQHMFPKHNWEPFDFTRAPRYYWNDMNNQRNKLDAMAEKMNMKHLDDWYNVTWVKAERAGGSGLLVGEYNGSIWRAVNKVYPKHNWDIGKLHRMPHSYWNDPKRVIEFLTRLEGSLRLSHLDDWYTVSQTQIYQHGGGAVGNQNW